MEETESTGRERPSRPRAMREKAPVVAMGVAGLTLVIGGAVFTPVSAQVKAIRGEIAAPATQWSNSTPPGAEYVAVPGGIRPATMPLEEQKPATQPTTAPAAGPRK